MPDCAVIVVSFNTRDMTLACLRSLLDSPAAERLRVIVVDNASTDGSALAIATEFADQIELIESEQNLGFAAANNLAAKEVTEPWTLLLNPDTLVRDDAVGELLRFAERHPESKIFGGRTLFADDTPNPTSCWMRPTPWSALCQAVGLTRFRGSPFFNPEQPDAWDANRPERVDIVSGCFFLIRTELWRKLEGFDEAFFMYGEEADLCLRARAHDANPRVCDRAVIVHYGGASEKRRAGKLVRLLGAKRRLAQRHWSLNVLAKPLIALWPMSRLLATTLASPLSAAAREQRSVWGEVWSRRREWLRDV